jgi:hypothetical protein
MTLRRSWLLGCVLCLGCQALVLPDGDADPDAPAASRQDGQTSGNEQRPLGFFDKAVVDDPAATRSHLSLASEALQQGDEAAACEHLGKYLAQRPEHNEVRLHYAELLLRHERQRDAKAQYTRFIAQAQERGDQTLDDRILCHSRLMDIAAAEDDEFGERYHRGLGMYLLSLERVKLGDISGALPVEALLCRAAGELTTAYRERPGEAQPCWYLCKVWSALGQQSAATRWLKRAEAAAPFSLLTPAEQRGLQLALATQNQAARRP